MAHPVDDLGQAVAGHVPGEDLNAGRHVVRPLWGAAEQRPLRVKGPGIVDRIFGGLEPPFRREDVNPAVAVHVSRADPVPGLLGPEFDLRPRRV